MVDCNKKRTESLQKNPIEIGARLAQLRGDERSQQDVANALGVRRETITQWENGTRRIKDIDIIRLSDYFGVSCDYILRGVQAENVDIYRQTGLSNEAIESLKQLSSGKDEYIDLVLNKIISEDYLLKIVDNLSAWVIQADSYADERAKLLEKINAHNSDYSQSERLYRYPKETLIDFDATVEMDLAFSQFLFMKDMLDLYKELIATVAPIYRLEAETL